MTLFLFQQRIGSQAFFGKLSVGYRLLWQSVYNDCDTTSPPIPHCNTMPNYRKRYPDICNCIDRVKERTLDTLKRNSSMWFRWFQAQGFGDEYMPNYYVRRLNANVRGLTAPEEMRSKTVQKVFNKAFHCLNSSSCNMNGFHLLHGLSAMGGCNYPWKPPSFRPKKVLICHTAH